MDLELHIEELETERRWNRLEEFRGDGVLGRFLAYRDDNTFVWLGTVEDRQSCLSGQARLPVLHVKRDTVVHLRGEGAHLDRLAESPLIELRQYRLVPGVRRRFADFLRERAIPENERLGMPIHGPFDSLDDENVLVWFRGFPDLQERDRRKAQFYQGKLWLDELEAIAMPMIEDYRNVLLLTPAR